MISFYEEMPTVCIAAVARLANVRLLVKLLMPAPQRCSLRKQSRHPLTHNRERNVAVCEKEKQCAQSHC